MAKFYLTTTLPYVNDRPHIGFALEIVQADAWVRFHQACGDDVFFNTGTDEHGQKIFNAAEKAGQTVTAYADRYAEEFRKLKQALGLSESLHFVRTTDRRHEQAAQEMWRRCKENGDIEKRTYEGLYCVGCEKFLTEKEIENGVCAIHGTPPQLLKEENWFFKLSRYQEKLLAYLQDGVIIPDWRRQEAINFVREGLEDFSISREKKKLPWGIPVPDDDTQVMYVWFDALTSYISTLGWPDDPDGHFRDFWEGGTAIQMAGKDQVRFQSIMWQAMLMSAGVKSTNQVFYHGFINSGGQKMSKSLGNVISPDDLIAKYGLDATRYMLLRHVHATEDTDVTWDKLDEWYTANLSNGLGNLTARIMKLAEDNLSVPVFPAQTEFSIENPLLKAAMQDFNFNAALEVVWISIANLDASIQNKQPFKVVKEDPQQGREMIMEHVRELAHIAAYLQPFMPDTSKKILHAILANKKPENLFPRLD